MFTDPKNRGKIFSFLFTLTLVIITTFFVNSNKEEVEKISGQIARIDKNMEASLSLYLLAKSDFSYAMLYNTLGLLHIENGHSFSKLYIPYADAFINGMKSINEAIGEGDGTVDEEKIQALQTAFTMAAQNNNPDDFFSTFGEAGHLVAGLNMAYKTNTEQQASEKLLLKNKQAELEVKASLLTWIAAIIGFMQLFFSSFHDMYFEHKKSKNQTPKTV